MHSDKRERATSFSGDSLYIIFSCLASFWKFLALYTIYIYMRRGNILRDQIKFSHKKAYICLISFATNAFHGIHYLFTPVIIVLKLEQATMRGAK